MGRLLPRHLASRSSNRTVELCTCLGDLCNDYPWAPPNESAAARAARPGALLVGLLLLLHCSPYLPA